MAYLYTPKQIQEALIELRIKPNRDGMVTGQEAARILTWRAQAEQGIEHQYLDSAVRRHVQSGHLTPYPVNPRYNLYKVEDVFDLALVPRRGIRDDTQKRKAIRPAA